MEFMMPHKNISAWLVIWQGAGKHEHREGEVAAILNPRFSGRRVAEIVELLYANATSTLEEKILYAKNRRNNPYPARFGTIGGVSWEGEISCGANPWLYARLVKLHMITDESGKQKLLWTNRPQPNVSIT